MNAASIAQRFAPRPAAAVPAPTTANADGTLYALQYLRGLAALAIVQALQTGVPAWPCW